MSVIEVRSLTKSYGEKKGVFDLSFTVKAGRSLATWAPTAQAKPPPSGN